MRLKALLEGRAGEAWLAGLARTVADLEAEWGLSLGRTLSGGAEAFVAGVMVADGRAAVLELALPGRDPTEGESRTLPAARGRGHTEVYRHDADRGAMLLERLGPRLDQFGLPVGAQIEAICATLRETWTPSPDGTFMTGAEKAVALAGFIETTWLDLGRPCPERTIKAALRCAEDRRRRFDPDRAVLAHGDAHACNTLLVPGGEHGGSGRFKFVDPDGLIIERAYNLGVLMREWPPELTGDPLALGAARCRRLAGLTGVAPGPIWRWGLIERVSTGLLCLRVGLEGGRDMLAVADVWASADTSAGGAPS